MPQNGYIHERGLLTSDYTMEENVFPFLRNHELLTDPCERLHTSYYYLPTGRQVK